MLYELRQYSIDPAKWDEYLAWFETRTAPLLFERFGFRQVAMWQGIANGGPQPGGDAPELNLHWLLAWESEEEMRERWQAIAASDAYRAVWAEAVDAETGKPKYNRQLRTTLLRSLTATPIQ